MCGKCCTKISSLSVDYGQTHILENVDLHVHCGELTAVVGPNGGGKTTLLKALLGEVRYGGEIHFIPKSGGEKRPRIGYVPQHVSIDRDVPVSVRDLFAVSRSVFPAWIGIRNERLVETRKALEIVSAAHLANRRIGELSGGELQRVLLACALVPLPEILLLDEPVSGVDARGLAAFYETICNLRHSFDMSIILVTHDLAAIAPHADRMVLLNKKILADGKPKEVLSSSALVQLMGAHFMNLSLIPKDGAAHEELK